MVTGLLHHTTFAGFHHGAANTVLPQLDAVTSITQGQITNLAGAQQAFGLKDS